MKPYLSLSIQTNKMWGRPLFVQLCHSVNSKVFTVQPQPPKNSPPKNSTEDSTEDSNPEPLYRPQAYQQRGRVAPIDGILRVSAPREWLVLIILALVVAGVIVWSVLGRLESGINAACTLQAAGERYVVAAPASGVVTEVLFESGEQVSAGDPLVRIAAPEISLAAEVADARAAAVAAQHPDSPEAAGAAAEAEVLRAAEAAGTLVLSPADGIVAPLIVSPGTAVNPGSAVAEVLGFGSGPPTLSLAVASADVMRIAPFMEVSVVVTPAGTTKSIHTEARLSESSPRQAPQIQATQVPPNSGTPRALLEAELEGSPTAFETLARQTETTYGCEARIITESRRPIQMLIGRS